MRDAFVTALKEQLKGREAIDTAALHDTLSDLNFRASALNDMVFTADGALRVTFVRGAMGAPAAGDYVVTFSKVTVTPWLSAFGRRVQQQTVTPSGSLALGASSSPTPAVPTHTASGDDDTDCKKVTCVAVTFDDGPAAPGEGRDHPLVRAAGRGRRGLAVP